MPRERTLLLMLQCNDWQNGSFNGILGGLDVAGISIEPRIIGAECTCRFLQNVKRFGLGRKTYPYFGSQTWVGNWCWDAVLVTPGVAASVLNDVRRMRLSGERKYCIDSGPEGAWQLWNGDADMPFTGEFLMDCAAEVE